MVEKAYIGAEELLQASFELGLKVLDSGFKPDYIVGVWRGGSPVGIAVQELLDVCGVETDHIAIRTSLYSGIDTRHKKVRVHGLTYIIKSINNHNSLLIVDDVYDTGLSIRAIIDHLNKKARRNTPDEIRVATAYYKPNNNRTDRVPDYYVHESDKWLVFPHELHGLSGEEIYRKPGIEGIADRIHLYRTTRKVAEA